MSITELYAFSCSSSFAEIIFMVVGVEIYFYLKGKYERHGSFVGGIALEVFAKVNVKIGYTAGEIFSVQLILLLFTNQLNPTAVGTG